MTIQIQNKEFELWYNETFVNMSGMKGGFTGLNDIKNDNRQYVSNYKRTLTGHNICSRFELFCFVLFCFVAFERRTPLRGSNACRRTRWLSSTKVCLTLPLS